MSGFARKFTAAAVAMSLVTIPTGAIAAAPAAPAAVAPAVAAPTANPWLTLGAMTSSSTAAAAAAQDYDDGPGFPPIAPLVVILATIGVAIWILTKGDNDGNLHLPVSPS